MAGDGERWREIARYGEICRDMARYAGILRDIARYGRIWCDMAGYGEIWRHIRLGLCVHSCSIPQVLRWQGRLRSGMASAEGEESETQPLTPDRGEKSGAGWSESSVLKYGSLGLVIVQNSSHVLLLRYSRVAGGECDGYVARRAASAGPAAAAAAASPAQPQSEFTAARRVSALPRLCARSLRSCALSLSEPNVDSAARRRRSPCSLRSC